MLKVVRTSFSADMRNIHSLLKSRAYPCFPSTCVRCYGVEKQTSLSKAKPSSEVGSVTYEKVKETTKTVSYLGVILAGVGVTGIMFYAIFRELFSSKSSNSVYSKAVDRCCQDQRVQFALGEPLKGYGEETRRGRRRHTNHLYYERDGVKYLRMRFYIQGIRKKGTVHLEMQENASGAFEYRYLFVQLDDYPHTTIILEDNRREKKTTFETLSPLSPEFT